MVRAEAVLLMEDSQDTLQFAELSIKALKHVMVAKPDRLNLEQIQYLKKLAEESGVVLQLGTGYKYCPAYNVLKESAQTAKVVDVRLQVIDICNLTMELFYTIDFVTSILNVGIKKFDVRSWKNDANIHDLFHYRLECDNASIINITTYKVLKGETKFEITFVTSEIVISADVFKSVVKKRYRIDCETDDSVVLNDYCEKSVNEKYLQIFNSAIDNDLEAVKIIEKQFQNMLIAMCHKNSNI